MLPWAFIHKFLCGCMFSFLLDRCPRVQLLGHTVTLCLAFRGTAKLFSEVAAPFLHFYQYYVCFNFSTSSPTRTIFCLSDYSHRSGREVISHCVLTCVSLTISDAEHLFMCLLPIPISSLEKYLSNPLTTF